MSTSRRPMDSLDALIDFSQFEEVRQHSSSYLPIASAKSQLLAPPINTAASFIKPSSSPPLVLSGPSHQYELFKQQTPFAPGAIATTLAVTQMPMGAFGPGEFDYSSLDAEFIDFGDSSSLPADLDMDFDPQLDSRFLFPGTDTINPSAIEHTSPSSITSLPSPFLTAGSVGRLWPGAHSQAALAKAQIQARAETQAQTQAHAIAKTQTQRRTQTQKQPRAQTQAQRQQQQQQEQLIAQQRQRTQPNTASSANQDFSSSASSSSPALTPLTAFALVIGSSLASGPKSKAECTQSIDFTTEQKIGRLIDSMKSKSVPDKDNSEASHTSLSMMRKDDEDMDDDERLLVSEEGKKLTSKERRQLRNKVSARAFRSRRKEYITQLEAEIASKVTENGVLRSHNRALLEENKRLSDLSRVLLSSPSFSGFLDELTTNASRPPQATQQHFVKSEELQPELRKNINSCPASQQADNLQMGIAMIPEPTVYFSSRAVDRDANAALSFQPLVFALLATPDLSLDIDSSILSGKMGDLGDDPLLDSDIKTFLPFPEHLPLPIEQAQAVDVGETCNVDLLADDDFESDPSFALYHHGASATAPDQRDAGELPFMGDCFVEIGMSKLLVTLCLTDGSTEEDDLACHAFARVRRICRRIEAISDRTDRLLAA